MRNLIPLALASTLLFAAPALATNVITVKHVGLAGPSVIVHLNDGVVSENVYMMPQDLTTTANQVIQNLLCVDMDHVQPVGNTMLTYSVMSLGDYLSSLGSYNATMWSEIVGMTNLAKATRGTLTASFAQGVVWDLLHPNPHAVTSPSNLTYQNGVNALLANVSSYADPNYLTDGRIYFAHYADNRTATGLDGQILIGQAPEPGTWAMMLVGFGALGFVMRRRRSVSTAVAFG